MQCSIWSFLPPVSCSWSSKCCVLSGLFYLLSHVAGGSKCCVLSGLFYLLSRVSGDVNAVFYLVFSTSCLM